MAKELNIIDELRKHIDRTYESQSAAARDWGVSRSHVCNMLKGRVRPTDRMLEDMGIVRVDPPARYERKKQG